MCSIVEVINSYIHLKGEYMTKAQEIAELEQRLGREIALEYFKNEKRVVSEEEAEIEDLRDSGLSINDFFEEREN